MKKNTIMRNMLRGGMIALVFFVGYFAHSLMHSRYASADSSTSQEVGLSAKDFGLFWEVWKTVEHKYPFDDIEPTNKERLYAATAGMVDAFDDPYTVFLSPDDTEIFEGDVKGEFGGVGMEVGMRDGFVTVIAPLKDSPADRAGVLAGDIIYQVDGIDVYGDTVEEAIVLIRGEVGASVKIAFLREGQSEPVEITIVRDVVNIPVLDYELREDGVFVISFYSFTRNAFEKFNEAIVEFDTVYKKGEAKGLVVDVRSNPGGYLNVAVDIISLFLPEGTPIVREKAGDAEEFVYRSKGVEVLKKEENIPMVILIDGGSASASEILAGALTEHGVATTVGQKTFGKGSVQEFLHLRDNSSLKVTIAKWFTPNGVSIDDEGVMPDVEVAYTHEDAEADRDPQLMRAIEIVLEK